LKKHVELEMTTEMWASIEEFISDNKRRENSTHGGLTLELLLELFLEDVSLMLSRPGCWEADAMTGLLESHGYG
jgi:hypothetical protein